MPTSVAGGSASGAYASSKRRSRSKWRGVIVVIGIISCLLILCQYRLISLLHRSPPPLAYDDDAEGSTDDASPAVSAIVEAYREAVKHYVKKQIITWNNIVGLASDKYTVRRRTDDVDDVPAVRSGARSLAKESPQTTATHNDIIWDHESDIATYFQELMSRCSVSNFTYLGCFGYLHSLAADPRCTTSLDSRYTCDGGEVREASRSAEDVIRDHLTDDADTVNIIVIGAGPVGLLLANALSNPGGVRPPGGGRVRTRVLVFENRVVKSGQEGRKRPYTRDWPTELHTPYFDAGGGADPRISSFFRLIFEEDYATVPIYAIETLLLLSNRDRGVRFIYGDYGDYADALAGVRKAIVFDATGHRLDLVGRDGDDPYDEGREAPHHAAPMDAADTINLSIENKKFREFVVGRNATVLVAEHESAAGLVKYPINRANGHPFQIHYLKMYRLWSKIEDEAFLRVWWYRGRNARVWNESFNTEENLFCRDACNVTACDVWNDESKRIWKMCSVATRYDWKNHKPREDITTALSRVALEDALFATSVSFLSLLPGQANAFADLHKGKRGVEMPLKDINLEALLADPIFQTNSIDKWLRLVRENASDQRAPMFALVAYRPYIYPDPVIPPVSLSPTLARLGAPVLRIGDSLFTGDPNIANGLSRHVRLVSHFSQGVYTSLQKTRQG